MDGFQGETIKRLIAEKEKIISENINGYVEFRTSVVLSITILFMVTYLIAGRHSSKKGIRITNK